MTTVGVCQEMCPSIERSSSWKGDPKKCVKEFSRAAAGQALQKPCDLRPPQILKRTVLYLFQSVISEKLDVEPYVALYDFVFDRLRAVRQDMVVQHVYDEDCVHVLECIVRFHVYSIFRLCEEPISNFDPHINGTHLQECMKRLLVGYENGLLSKNRAEIEAYYLLYNLGSLEALRHALSLPKQIMAVRVVSIAFQLSIAWLNNNFYRVLRLVRDLPFLHCAAVMQNVPSIRNYRLALRILSHGFSAKNCRYPVDVMMKMLAFDDDLEFKETCTHYSIQRIEDDENRRLVIFDKSTFAGDRDSMPLKRYGFVNEKHENINLVEILYGEKDQA